MPRHLAARLTLAGLAAALVVHPDPAPAAAAAPTQATTSGTLVYVKGNDVYLARPDGTGERRLTTNGTAAEPWLSPTGDDQGRVVAARGDRLYRMDRTGAVLDSFDPPDVVDPWLYRYGGKIAAAAVSPDGTLVAYTYRDFHCVFSECHDYAATGVSTSNGSDYVLSPGVTADDNPAWVTDSRLVGNGIASLGVRLFDLPAGAQGWFSEGSYPSYVPLTEPTVSRDGTMLALTRGSGADARVTTYQVSGDVRTGSPVPAPTVACESQPAAGQGSPALAPDGSAIAWSQATGIWIRRDPLDCSAAATLVVPGGHDVSWSKAELPPAPSVSVLTLTKAPKVTGKARLGKVLRVRGAVWSGGPTSVGYQWLRNGRTIRAATTASYRITRKDRGKRISVRLTARKPGVRSVTWTSKPVRVRR